MRVMIAGADLNTVTGIASYLTDCGHNSESTRNGVECMAVLRGFTPDLLVLEFDILWGGCDGVLAVMNDDPQLKDVPVVLFTERYKQMKLEANPRIIATLTHPFQPHELSKLNELLETMNSARTVNSCRAQRNGQSSSHRKTTASR